MSFALSSKSSLGESLAHVAAGEIDSLLRAPSGGDAAPSTDDRVHETRKSIKRLRALLRLYRGALADTLYRSEDDRLRELAHALGGARDAAAVRESLERLVHSAVAAERAELADAVGILESALDEEPRASKNELESALGAVHDGLGALRDRAMSWRVERGGWSAIAPGFRRTYARGRRGLARALHRPSENRLHSWRIGVKRHQYQLTLLEPLWPEPVKAFRHEAQQLGELLGQDHDLVLLERRFEKLVGRPQLASLERPFRSAASRCHAELRSEAFALGARIYAEAPRRLVARYREYFDTWV